jgi:hypothetical protein
MDFIKLQKHNSRQSFNCI